MSQLACIRNIALALTLFIAPAFLHAADKLKVVTTTTVLSDIVHNVGGTLIENHCLLKPGVDAHNYEPTPDDVKTVTAAGLVIMNGLGFERWIEKLIQNSGYKGGVIVASRGIVALKSKEEAGHADEAHEEEPHHGDQDPHCWQDVSNGIRLTENIRDALVAADPANADAYKAAAASYLAQLRALDAWVKREFAMLPKSQRKLVTSHDAFQYLGKAYGIEIQAVEGLSTEHEADAKHIAEVIEFIKTQHVKAVFIENVSNPKTLDQIMREAGVALGGSLFSDSLGPADHPAGTYIGMFRSNVETILAALR